ncbi:hypothetical protein FRX31_013409 [Thalictrum thalictroides]|uniref:Uncharacterized protein n=1 Tax=Thalictrum thalictroides TaxID=46969 RepID=A0A7J6WLL0_THATH|nr:hypothetical protein FRX31_013409 [Thalictrum thalictroides]
MNRATAQILESGFILIKSLAPTLAAQERPWPDEITLNSEDHSATVGDIEDGFNNILLTYSSDSTSPPILLIVLFAIQFSSIRCRTSRMS